MFLPLPLGRWGKWLWQAPEIRYGLWLVCLLCVPEASSSPVGAKMTIGWCSSHVCCLSVPCLDIEMNSLTSPQSFKADSRRESQEMCDSDEGFYHHSPLLIFPVCPPAVWREGIVVIIAFKTSLGSGPRIFQLWSVKPITYLLREDTQSYVDESLCVRANLCHLLWQHHIPSVLKYSVSLLFCGSLALQYRIDNAMNSEVFGCQNQLVAAMVLLGRIRQTAKTSGVEICVRGRILSCVGSIHFDLVLYVHKTLDITDLVGNRKHRPDGWSIVINCW